MESHDRSSTPRGRRRVAIVAAGLFTLASTSVLVPTAAQAASPPSCVSVSTWGDTWTDYAQSYNGCSTTKRFYFQWDRDVDGPCHSDAPRAGWFESRWSVAQFRSLISC